MTSEGSRIFEYDEQNRLTKVTQMSDGSLIASFEYDADGRRTSKTTPTETIKYFYDGDSTRVLYETDGSGNLLVRYIFDQRDQLVAMVRDGETYFYHFNFRGDVVALTDSTGAVVAEYDYDSYGQPVATGLEGTVENTIRYAGYRWDAETGMYYLNARYYWPAVGRFITRDSFHGFEDEPLSLNQYNYAHSNPMMYVDPSGHSLATVFKKVGFSLLISVFKGSIKYFWQHPTRLDWSLFFIGTIFSIKASAVGAFYSGPVGFALGALSGVAAYTLGKVLKRYRYQIKYRTASIRQISLWATRYTWRRYT